MSTQATTASVISFRNKKIRGGGVVKMPRIKIPYKEGDWIAVPLKDGGYGLGITVRIAKGGGIAGYFFAPRHPNIPTEEDTKGLNASKVILIARFGDLGLLRGEWSIVCHSDNWRREDWPLPEFGRIDSVDSSIGYRTAYCEENHFRVKKETKISVGEALLLQEDGLFGYIALAIRLNRLLL